MKASKKKAFAILGLALSIIAGTTLYFALMIQNTVINTEFVTVTVIPEGQFPGGIGLPSGGKITINTVRGRTESVSVPLPWGSFRHNTNTGILGGRQSDSSNIIVDIPASSSSGWRIEIDREYRFDLVRSETFLFGTLIRTSYTTNIAFMGASARGVEL